MDNIIFKEDQEKIAEILENNEDFQLKFKLDLNFWRCKLSYESHLFFFDLVYHSLYPAFPPKIFCYNDSTYSELSINDFWKGRIFQDFSICLFPNDSGESAWKDSYRIDMVLKKFKKYVMLKLAGKISEEHTSIKFNLEDYSINEKYYINPRIYGRIFNENVNFIYYHAFSVEEFSVLPFQTIFGFFIDEKSRKFNELRKKPVKIVKLSIKEYEKFLRRIVSHKSENIDFLLFSNDVYINNKISEDLLIIPEKKDEFPLIFFHWNRKIYLKNYYYSIIDSKQGFYDLLYQRQKSLATTQFTNFKNIKIILIGLGSLGSKIYEELIHNGIQNLVIYDPDIYKPENVMRSFIPLPYLGLPKAFAMKEFTHFLSPKVNVIGYNGSPFNPMVKKKFFEHLKESDLVISTIDYAVDEYELNEVCLKYKKPLIFGTCLKNARFGRVFRVKQNTPCLVCINHQIDKYPDKYPSMASEQEEQDLYHQSGIPGINLDIKEIANKIVRFAFQTLAEQINIKNFFDPVEYNHILIGNYQGWVFEEPGMMKIQDFPKWTECPVCGENDNR